MDTANKPPVGQRAYPGRLAIVIWILAVGATVGGLLHGLPPKSAGPYTATILWYPFATLLYGAVSSIPGKEFLGIMLVLLQFPAIAAGMTIALRKQSARKVAGVAAVLYLGAAVASAVYVKLNWR